MNIYPKISIITPSFNQGQYLEKTIQSVISQNYPNLEYIIIDGGSTDNSVEIIKKYEKYLKYWVSESDNGQSNAINKGLKHATGDIINWLNSDDYLEPNALQIIAKNFTNSHIEVLCGYACLIYGEKTVKKQTSQQAKNFEKLIAVGHIMQPATFFKKSIFDELTPLEESLHYMMDLFIWWKYLLKYGTDKIKYIDHLLVNVLMHKNAKSVEALHLFNADRERLISSLFASIGYNGICCHNKKNLLSYKINVDFLPQQIDFYHLKYHLFKYDYQGKRQSLQVWNLLKLILLLFKNPFFKKNKK